MFPMHIAGMTEPMLHTQVNLLWPRAGRAQGPARAVPGINNNLALAPHYTFFL